MRRDLEVLEGLPTASEYDALPQLVHKNVWRWWHKPSQQWHRIKVDTSERGRYLLANEAAMLARLHSLKVPRQVGFYPLKPYCFSVCGFAAGDTLAYLIRKQGHRFSGVGEVVRQLIEVIEECHLASIVHTDVKPNNIVYDGHTLHLIDFGHAANTGCALDQRAYRGYSPSYSLPQLQQGQGSVTVHMDWYSCLVVVYVLLHGQLPSLIWHGHAPIKDAFGAVLKPGVLGNESLRFLRHKIQALDEYLQG